MHYNQQRHNLFISCQTGSSERRVRELTSTRVNAAHRRNIGHSHLLNQVDESCLFVFACSLSV